MPGAANAPHKPLLYLDTNAIVYFVEGEPNVAEALSPLFQALRSKPGVAVTSELTLAEVLAPTTRRGKIPNDLKRSYLDLIVWSAFIGLEPISRGILYDTAEVRLKAKLELPDAIHLVTAMRMGCSLFLTSDRGIKTPPGMAKIAPDQSGISKLLSALA
jgi:predicted nucleic acid-binding protein